MKIVIEANEKEAGCQIIIEMNGEVKAQYLPEVIHQLLKGISSHGEKAGLAVAMGIHDYVVEDLKGEMFK